MSGGFAFLMMLFELYMALMTFPQREREQGSTTFLCWLLLMQGFISAVFLLINYLLTFTSPENSVGYWMAPNTGLWPILLLTLTLRSLATPDGSTNFWGVMQIPNKWYPLFLGAFFCLMGGFQWNIVVAVAMGYGYPYLRLERALPSRMWANSCEQRCCGRGRSCLGAYWVRAADTAGYELESGDRRYATLSDFGRSNQAQQANRSSNTTSSSGQGGSTANANFIAFSGSGNRLGEGEADSIVPQHSEPAAAQEEEQEQGAGSPEPTAEPAADAAVSSAPSKAVPGKELKASAPAFVPASVQVESQPDELAEQAKNILSMAAARGEAKQAAEAAKADMMNMLPESHRRMLRNWYQDAIGNCFQYYVGNLKSYSSRKGFGFLQCAQAEADFGQDVFIHKNNVPMPFHVGQPCEFAVMSNTRGQPQAIDVKWLPLLPQHKKANGYGGYNVGAMGTFSAAAPMPAQAASTAFSSGSTAASSSASPAVAGGMLPQAAPNGASKPLDAPRGQPSEAPGSDQGGASEHRYLGALKSYSPAQGYGFLSCEEVWSSYSRDTYFDKSQMLKPVWNIGQTVEFSITLNTRNQPQARSINWDPVPLQPQNEKQGGQAQAQAQQKPRSHQAQTMERLKKILHLTNVGDAENAMVAAIDSQGELQRAQMQAEGEMDIDFVSFAIDRMGNEEAAMKMMKDFVKMLTMLMLVKMLRRKYPRQRMEQLVRWVDALSQCIDPFHPGVKDHSEDCFKQTCGHIDFICSDNQDLGKDGVVPVLKAVEQRLKAKLQGTPENAPEPVVADGSPAAQSMSR